MANKFKYNYKKISNPYNDFLERGEKNPYGINIEQREGEVKDPFDVGDNVIEGNSISNLWISNWIKSRNYKPGSDGCYIDGKTGNVEFNKGLFRGSIVIQNTDDVRSDLNVEDGSTAGADWNSNLSNIPNRHKDTATTGLNLTPDYLGYYDGSSFQSYIDKDGNFQFRGDDNNKIDWNLTESNTLTIRGLLNANDIETGTLDADKVTVTGTITGATLQTSSNSYEGVKMSSDIGGMKVYGESLYFYDTDGDVTARMVGNNNNFNITTVDADRTLVLQSAHDIEIITDNSSTSSSGALTPYNDANSNLGTSSKAWRNIYASGYLDGGLRISQDLNPLSSSIHSLGSSDKKWSEVHTNELEIYSGNYANWYDSNGDRGISIRADSGGIITNAGTGENLSIQTAGSVYVATNDGNSGESLSPNSDGDVNLGSDSYTWGNCYTYNVTFEDGKYLSQSGNNLKVYGFSALELSGDLETDVWRSDSDTSKYIQYSNGFECNDDFYVGGTLSKSAGSFQIDHPLDPDNKWLKHSFVESPDMLNVYRGNNRIKNKECKIQMPDWFIPLNGANKKNYSYILTSVGQQNNLWVKEEMNNKGEVIFAGEKDGKFSYMITAIRHDKYATDNRIQVEEPKK